MNKTGQIHTNVTNTQLLLETNEYRKIKVNSDNVNGVKLSRGQFSLTILYLSA